jgi:hypothetical protein
LSHCVLDRVTFSQALEGNTKAGLKQHRKDSKTGVDLSARVDIGFCLNGLFSLLKQLYQPHYKPSDPVYVVVNRCICHPSARQPDIFSAIVQPTFLIRVGAPFTSPITLPRADLAKIDHWAGLHWIFTLTATTSAVEVSGMQAHLNALSPFRMLRCACCGPAQPRPDLSSWLKVWFDRVSRA